MSAPSTIAQKLGRDPVSIGAAIVLVAVLVPYALPVFSEDQQWWWDNVIANLLLYGAGCAASLHRVARIPSAIERRYWRVLALGMGSIVALYIVWTVVALVSPAMVVSWQIELLSQTAYLAFYLSFALALDVGRPSWSGVAVADMSWLRTAGLGVILGGVVLYFTVVPLLVNGAEPLDWIPLLLIYSALDALLCLQFLRARSLSSSRRWRSVLGWTGLALGVWSLVDFAEAAFYLGWLGSLSDVMELQWYVPSFLFIVGARLHLVSDEGAGDRPPDPSILAGGTGLIAWSVVPLVVHFSLDWAGVMDPGLRTPRDILVLALVLMVLALAWAYQRSVEHQNRDIHRELALSRARYRTFVESSLEGIWQLAFDPLLRTDESLPGQMARMTRQAHVIECNEAMATMLGLGSPGDLVGRSLDEILRSTAGNEANSAFKREFVESGYRVRRAPFEITDASGYLRKLEGSMVGVVEGEFLVGAWATYVDVSGRYEAEAVSRRLERQLQRAQRLETIGTLAGGIAHDFNNTLAPILGFTELAAESVRDDAQGTRRYLGQVTAAANQAKVLINQILSVGRHEKGNREVVDVVQVVNEAVGLLAQAVPSYVAFRTEYGPGPYWVHADPGQIHQVVMNLCTNAWQAIGERPGNVLVRVGSVDLSEPPGGSAFGPGRYVLLSVEDDGVGMPPRTQDRAFEAFFTTKRVGEGSGLGLSVTHGIVKAHDGHIHISSQEGLGTTMTVYLPASAAVGLAPATPTGNERPSLTGLRVMLVDDEPAIAELVTLMLEGLGCSVRAFTDSESARDVIALTPGSFDVLVTDHTMPAISGPQLVRHARLLRPDIAVVIASGYRLRGDDGLDDVVRLDKPFSRAEFELALARALRQRPTPVP